MNQMGSRFLMCITTQEVTRPLDKDEIDTIHFLIKHVNPNKEQEWSSMESNSYENWDEIEMFSGHLVISNLQLVIGNRPLAIVKR